MATATAGDAAAPAAEKRIVAVGLDSSASSHRALEWATKHLILGADTELILVYVRPEAAASASFMHMGKVDTPDDVAQALTKANVAAEKHAAHVLEKAVAFVKKTLPSANVEGVIRIGDPRTELVHICDDADTLVLGARGMSAVKKALLGSVSSYVSQHAPASCAVVVVR